VQDQFTLAATLILNAGLRHDRYYTFGGTTNPRVALIFTPQKSTTLKLIYGQAFRAPNNYELYFRDGFSIEQNPHLVPERIRSFELVMEQNLGPAFRLSASGFDNRIMNLIVQQVDPLSNFLVYRNSADVQSRGVELEIAGKTYHEIEGRVSYSVQRTENASTGSSLSNSPTQLVKMNVNAPLFRGGMSLGLEARYTDPRKTGAGTYAGRYGVANFTSASREFGGGYRLSASVYNLFNTRFSDPVGAEIAAPAVTQNGRDFRVQITRSFHFH
jgi:iron complex outermembrane receptor protein